MLIHPASALINTSQHRQELACKREGSRGFVWEEGAKPSRGEAMLPSSRPPGHPDVRLADDSVLSLCLSEVFISAFMGYAAAVSEEILKST